jgi:4-amino-4-deoxy-L-arabinose transferase-like glycosyltransferase
MAAALALGIAWSLVTPAWQAPDENSHFAFVQSLAEAGRLPGDASRAIFSTEQSVAASPGASNADQAAAQIATKMQASTTAFRRWRDDAKATKDSERSDGGGPNPASSNPPLYYLLETPAYLLTSSASIFTRLEALRIMSLLWLLGTIAGAWLLAGEIFGRDRTLQLLTAGAVGLAPMVLFLSATVGPDSALFALWSLALWLGVRLLKRGLDLRGATALLGIAGLGCLVKATTYALLPAVLLALGVAAVRAGGLRRPKDALVPLAGAAGALASTLGVYVVWTRLTGRVVSAQVTSVTGPVDLNIREMVAYVWQYYLPRLSFQYDFPSSAATIPVYDVSFKGVWAAFGWLEVTYPDWVYLVLVGLTVIVVVFAGAGVWKDRRLSDRWVVAFLTLAALGLLAGLHFTEYRQIKSGVTFMQGRYLLPLAPLAAIALARAVAWVPAPRRATAVAAILGGLLTLNLFSLGLVTTRFYA